MWCAECVIFRLFCTLKLFTAFVFQGIYALVDVEREIF